MKLDPYTLEQAAKVCEEAQQENAGLHFLDMAAGCAECVDAIRALAEQNAAGQEQSTEAERERGNDEILRDPNREPAPAARPRVSEEALEISRRVVRCHEQIGIGSDAEVTLMARELIRLHEEGK